MRSELVAETPTPVAVKVCVKSGCGAGRWEIRDEQCGQNLPQTPTPVAVKVRVKSGCGAGR